MKRNQNGFSLIELLVVVVIVGILATIAVIGYRAVVKGTHDKAQLVRLMQFVDAQNKFKTVKGKRRFGTITELQQEGLLNDSVIKFENGNQLPINDWLISPGDESVNYLRNHFFVTLYKANNTSKQGQIAYCIGDDGVLRTSVVNKTTQCDLNSAPVEP